MGFFDMIGSFFTGGMNYRAAKKQNEANLQAQREANQTNLQIAQMNNEYNAAQFQKQLDYNYDMWEKQSAFSDKQLDKQNAFNESMMDKSNQFQLDMWNRNNEYNSPTAQRERLQEAGLNPYMMMNGGSAGTAQFSGGTSASSGSSSTPSALGVSPPTASPVSVSPVMGDVTGMSNALQGMVQNVLSSKMIGAQVEKLEADTLNQKIKNRFESMNLIGDIVNKFENAKGTKLKNAYQDILNGFAGERQIQELNHIRQQNSLMRMQENIAATDYAMKQIQLVALPEQIKLELAQGWANVSMTKINSRMTEEQIRKIGQDYLESVARTKGIKLANKERRLCLDAFVRTAEANAKRAENTTGPSVLTNVFDYLGRGFDNAWNTGFGVFK